MSLHSSRSGLVFQRPFGFVTDNQTDVRSETSAFEIVDINGCKSKGSFDSVITASRTAEATRK
jgi:hypothetical protein